MGDPVGLNFDELSALVPLVGDGELRRYFGEIRDQWSAGKRADAVGWHRQAGERLLALLLEYAEANGKGDANWAKTAKAKLDDDGSYMAAVAALVKHGVLPRQESVYLTTLQAWANPTKHRASEAVEYNDADLQRLLGTLYAATNKVFEKTGRMTLRIPEALAESGLRREQAPELVHSLAKRLGVRTVRSAPGGVALVDVDAFVLWKPAEGVESTGLRGLRPFDFGDGPSFAGRDDLIEAVLRHVKAHPLAFLNGPSGSGKTSLVRAGLVPRWVSDGRVVLYLDGYGAHTTAVLDAARELLTETEVVVLDRFERSLRDDVSPDAQRAWLAAVCAANHRARVLGIVREDAVGRLLASLPSPEEGSVRVPDTRAFWPVRALRGAAVLRVLKATQTQIKTADVAALDEEAVRPLLDRDGTLSPTVLQMMLRLLASGGSVGDLHSKADEVVRGFVEEAVHDLPERSLVEALLKGMARDDERIDLDDASLLAIGLTVVNGDELAVLRTVRWIIDQLVDRHLVVAHVDDERRSRYTLAHDRVVAVIRSWQSPDDLDRAQAQMLLDRAVQSERSGTPDTLSAAQLAKIEKHARRLLGVNDPLAKQALERARRSRATLRGLLSSLAVLAFAGVVFGGYQMREQRVARRRAEANQARAERLAEYMVYDLREALDRYVPQEVREQISSRVDQYYREVGREGQARDDASLRREWTGQMRVGDDHTSGGRLAQAMTAYRAGKAIAQRQARRDPRNTEWQRDLSISHEKIGDVLVSQGDGAGALREFRECFAIRERLAQTDPRNADWQRDVSISHGKIGDVLRLQGDGAGALREYRESLAIMERLAQTDPRNTEWQRDLSVGHNNIGDVLVSQGDGAGALREYRESLAIFERLAQTDPRNTQWQRDLSISREKMALAFAGMNHAAEAIGSQRSALAISEREAIALPDHLEWQITRARHQWQLARMLAVAPATRPEAVTLADAALATLQQLQRAQRLTTEQSQQWLPQFEQLAALLHGRAPPAAPTAPSASREVTVSLARATGIVGLAAGSICHFTVRYSPSNNPPCQAAMVCGGHPLYGGGTSGWFACTWTPSSIRGGDPDTDDGDGAFAIDTDAHTVSANDIARDGRPAFSVEARITSVRNVPGATRSP